MIIYSRKRTAGTKDAGTGIATASMFCFGNEIPESYKQAILRISNFTYWQTMTATANQALSVHFYSCQFQARGPSMQPSSGVFKIRRDRLTSQVLAYVLFFNSIEKIIQFPGLVQIAGNFAE
jgi:hypothetical protein